MATHTRSIDRPPPSPGGHRHHRSIGLLVTTFLVAGLFLTGCGGDLTYRLNGGHVSCAAGLNYRINPAGFSQRQLGDIWIAAGMIGSESGTGIHFLGYTSESWATESPPPGVTYVLIEHRATSWAGRPAAATSSPWADSSGAYRGGSMWFNPSIDGLPAGKGLDSSMGSTYLKMALHEWAHYAGLDTVTGSHPQLIMAGATAPGLGSGDRLGLITTGCFSPAEKAQRLRNLGL
ncbi:MAG TPA: hypothetical protein VF320_01325 [Acidimicrobiales bacterium]